MALSHLLDIYSTLCTLGKNAEKRAAYLQFRNKYLQPELVKKAFDTRHIDQNLQMNPRVNLQNWSRSEPYINDTTARSIKLFFKVKNAADEIRHDFIGEPVWLDSYTRILCNAVDQTLMIGTETPNYSRNQIDYLNELLYVRYRLLPDSITTMSHQDLKSVLLNKDEKLVRRSVFINYKDDVYKNSMGLPADDNFNKHSTIIHAAPIVPDTLIDKLFNGVKASSEHKNVKRTVSITIDDSIVDPVVVKESEKESNGLTTVNDNKEDAIVIEK